MARKRCTPIVLASDDRGGKGERTAQGRLRRWPTRTTPATAVKKPAQGRQVFG